MKGLAELVVSLCDLCEAEGRLLEAGILRTVRRVALLSLGLLFGAAALALLLAALYALLTALMPTPAALALLGGASAAIAGVFLCGARGGAARAPGMAKAEEGARKALAPESVRKPQAVQTTSAPQAAGAPAGTHDPWATVAPYGHGSEPAAAVKSGKGGAPKGDGGMREKR